MRPVLLALTLLAIAASPAGAADAVVAFVDGGINPYHITFRDDSERAQQHPSTYLRGFPPDAPALRLTLDAPDYASAVAADCKKWRAVERGKLYWIPGTKIVGAIAFETVAPPSGSCEAGNARLPYILDGGGHGTMVASRGASVEYGACKACLIVAVQRGNNGLDAPGPYQEALRWTAAHRTWIDVQSNSWGPIVPVYDPTDLTILGGGPALIRTIEATSRVQPAFWASGNGAAFRGGVAGHPTPLAPHLTPSTYIVGGHDSGRVTTWPGFPPHVVADACNAFGAKHKSMDESNGTVSSGTSGATPYAAGGAAQLVLEARRVLGETRTGVRGDVLAQGPAGHVPAGPLVDGILTRDELRALVLATATPRPDEQPEDATTCTGAYGATPVRWREVPGDVPEFVLIGYGAVDRPAVTLGTRVLRGEATATARTRTDDYFSKDAQGRAVLHRVFTHDQAEPSPEPVPDGD